MRKTQHSLRYKTLMTALRRARVEAGLTQVEAARSLGKHPPFISKIESAERRVDVIELHEICAVYRIRILAFLKQNGID